MNLNKIFLFGAAALLLFSCSKEDQVSAVRSTRQDGKTAMFYASTEGTAPGTKIYADEDLRVLWNENDQISIFNCTNVNDRYMFDGEDGDNSGSFSLEEEGPVPPVQIDLNHIYAVYPYSASTQVSGGETTETISVDLPADQLYREKSFGVGANTMVAVTDGNFLGFKNVCGYLRFRFYGDNVTVKSIALEGNNGEKIAGSAVITPSVSAAPSVSIQGEATGKITINCPAGVELGTTSATATEFIFVVPPTVFSVGFKVKVTGSNGGTFEKSSTRSLTISRNKMESMGAMKVTLSAPEYVQFEDATFKAYCVANFDTDGDGEISKDEALAVPQIECYNCSTTGDYYTEEIGGKTVHFMKASSLKGIEEFKNLMVLIVRGAYTTHPGVSGPLTELNLSENSNLQYLDCSINDIASLDISNSPYLQYLDVSETKLLSLYVPEYHYLQNLYCYNCQDLAYINCLYDSNLTDFGFEGSYSLEYLLMGEIKFNRALDLKYYTELKEVNCMNSGVTFINFSGHTGCTELKNLYVQDNNLTVISGLSTLTSLEQLVCAGNKLETLDIHSNPALTLLRAWPQQEGTTLGVLVLSPAQADAIYDNTLRLYDNTGSITDSEAYTKYGTIFDMHY
ncbi:MAG: hypothetical protein IJG54_05820 [Bacteroidales bacterium]|nr:hypothetical protein [Bacteroidales bacterium]